MYDLIIIGAGPAGMTAGVYAAKNKLKTLVVAKAVLDYQSGNFNLLDYENLKKEFESQAKGKFLEFLNKAEVITLEKNVVSFSVEIKNGKLYYAKCVIIATGGAETNFDLITYKDQTGKIKVTSAMQTNIAGIFAAGSAAALSSQDIFVSAGQGAQAVLSVFKFLAQK